MKKLLTILGAVGLMATTGATVVACGSTNDNKEEKGAFPIEVDKKTIKVEEEAKVTIKDFAKLIEKYDVESFAVKTDEKEDAKIINVGDLDKEKGTVVVTGVKKGVVKLQISAKPIEEEGNKTFETEPVLSDSITITVNALKLSEVFKDKDLKEQTDAKAALAQVNQWISEATLEGKVEATQVQDKNEIKVSVTEDGKGYVEGELIFAYTLPPTN